MQNKPNFKMGNINISTATTKSYLNEQQTMNTKRYPKQSQFKPNPSPKLELCSTLSEVEGPIKPNSPAPAIVHRPSSLVCLPSSVLHHPLPCSPAQLYGLPAAALRM
jgi:hypothetical protein